MASEKAPNIGLNYGWDLGESGWNNQMDENLRAIDALLFPDAISSDTDIDSIATPVAGHRYIVPDSATGDWSGHDGKYARFDGTAWEFYTPKQGWRAFVQDLNTYLRHDGSDWASDISTTTALNLGDGVGVFLSKAGSVLGFKSLVAGSNIAFDNTTDPEEIIINASGAGGGGGIAEAPNDGVAYVRKALGWVAGIAKAGDKVTNLGATVHDNAASGDFNYNDGELQKCTLTAAGTVISFSNIPEGGMCTAVISDADVYAPDISALTLWGKAGTPTFDAVTVIHAVNFNGSVRYIAGEEFSA